MEGKKEGHNAASGSVLVAREGARSQGGVPPTISGEGTKAPISWSLGRSHEQGMPSTDTDPSEDGMCENRQVHFIPRQEGHGEGLALTRPAVT